MCSVNISENQFGNVTFRLCKYHSFNVYTYLRCGLRYLLSYLLSYCVNKGIKCVCVQAQRYLSCMSTLNHFILFISSYLASLY